MKIIFLGAAGSGKGTLSKKVSRDFSIPQLSTGDMLREIVAGGSELGKKIKSFQDNGILVPDDIVIEVLKVRLKKNDCKKGFILDGFPRNEAQAKLLKEITNIDIVFSLQLPDDVLVNRLVTRRICSKCGDIDNVDYAGYTGKCRVCGETLLQRNDDKPEAIKARLEVYKKQVAPLINFYGDKVYVIERQEKGLPEESYRPIKTFLEKLEAKH